MKTQSSTQAQDLAEEQQAFDDWLDSQEGREWLNAEAETEDEREGRTIWNHDGFSPEGCCYEH